MPYTILMIEDERDFSQPLAEMLETVGYGVQVADSIAAYRSGIDIDAVNLVILDRTLPDGDGISLLKEIRDHSDLPVIVLTGMSAISERVRGLNADADHYLIKPIDIDELLAIIQRHERKHLQAEASDNSWLLNARTWDLTSPSGVTVKLSHREACLIAKFAGIPGESVNRGLLVRAMGFDPNLYDFRRLETMMSRLRKKLQENGVEDFPLATIYGGCYALHASLILQGAFAE